MSVHTVGRKARILVVEDNPADVELLRLALSTANVDCDLTIIDDGGEAIAYVRQTGRHVASQVPDLAVLDLNVPKSEGVEILAAMRENPSFQNVPVAILSSAPWQRERARMDRLRVQRYIVKPPDLEEYLRIGFIIRELLLLAAAEFQEKPSGKEAGAPPEDPYPAPVRRAQARAAGISGPDPGAEY